MTLKTGRQVRSHCHCQGKSESFQCWWQRRKNMGPHENWQLTTSFSHSHSQSVSVNVPLLCTVLYCRSVSRQTCTLRMRAGRGTYCPVRSSVACLRSQCECNLTVLYCIVGRWAGMSTHRTCTLRTRAGRGTCCPGRSSAACSRSPAATSPSLTRTRTSGYWPSSSPSPPCTALASPSTVTPGPRATIGTYSSSTTWRWSSRARC